MSRCASSSASSGGIAAYKAALLLRLFTESGHDVTVVPTAAALRFVGAPTWAALSGKPVTAEVWTDVHEVPHVQIGQTPTSSSSPRPPPTCSPRPPTASPTTCSPTPCSRRAARSCSRPRCTPRCGSTRRRRPTSPPARARRPRHRPRRGSAHGQGHRCRRLPEPDELYAVCQRLVGLPYRWPPRVSAPPSAGTWHAGSGSGQADWRGRKVVVSAGGTREPLDPVRYLGNRSSGKQGYAIARAAAARRRGDPGRRQRLPPAPRRRRGRARRDHPRAQEAVLAAATDADVVVMAAAPADFRPATASDSKIKKGDGRPGLRLDLVENPDIVTGLVDERASAERRPLIVSFAAETGDATGSVLDHARAKFARKGSDLQVVNEVGDDKTFGQDDNTVHLLTRGGPDEVRTVGPAIKGRRRRRRAGRRRPLLDPGLHSPTPTTFARPAHHRTQESQVSARLFTSESVTEGHPDKICDQISDSILDAMLAEDAQARVAVETMVTTGLVHVAGEVSTDGYVEIPRSSARRSCASATTGRRRASTARPAACRCPSAPSRPTSHRASTPPTSPATAGSTPWTSRARATRG